MKYKKFILFQYLAYYPRGGLDDIKSSFDTIQEAIQTIRVEDENTNGDYWDYNEIVDRDTWEIVWSQPGKSR